MTLLSLTDPQNGTVADASLIATNNAAIKSVVNGELDNGNIASAAGIAISKLAGYPGDGTKALFGDGTWAVPAGTTGSTSIPVGAISMYGGASAPSGWLLLDGSTFSTSTYSALFSVIGSGTLPDMRGRVPAGYAASGGHSDVSTMFNNDGVAVANRRPSHHHTYTAPGNTDGTGSAGGVSGPNAPGTSTSGGTTVDSPSYLVVNFIIKT